MKLLLDANISWRLVAKLTPHFEDCFHVDHIALTIPANDKDIWDYALINNLIIITNDDGFLNLAGTKGFPTKVVLLRTSNQSNNYLLELLLKHRNEIDALFNSREFGFLEIF